MNYIPSDTTEQLQQLNPKNEKPVMTVKNIWKTVKLCNFTENVYDSVLVSNRRKENHWILISKFMTVLSEKMIEISQYVILEYLTHGLSISPGEIITRSNHECTVTCYHVIKEKRM